MSYSSPTGPIDFREEGVDIAAKYIGNADAGKINSYLNDEGKKKYGFGRLYSWGYNGGGALGLDDFDHRSSPVQVGSLTNWYRISAGAEYSLAIRSDNTLWSWGYNDVGQLGLGDITHRSSPVQVGALTNWSRVIAGYKHSLAVKTDGTLWAWGLNTNGRLGLGALTHRPSPVQVGVLTNWLFASSGNTHSLGILV